MKKNSTLILAIIFSLVLVIACLCASASLLFVAVRRENVRSDHIVETAIHQTLATATYQTRVAQHAETPTPASPSWTSYMMSGAEFQVAFDETYDKFDDSNYTGNFRTDPMGTLKGGEIYRVRFSFDEGWVVTGYNQDVGRTITVAYPAASASPEDNQICLWGAVYAFSDKGEVFSKTYGLVGHLQK